MGGHKCISGKTQEPMVPTPVDYHVTGNPVPDCTGNYLKVGVYQDRSYYRRVLGGWYLWFYAATQTCVISIAPGNLEDFLWQKAGPDYPGTYTPTLGSEGNANVVVGQV